MTGCIVGWAHLPFGKREDDDLESMIVRAAADAVADAGAAPGDIDEIIVGNFNGGFVEQAKAFRARPQLIQGRRQGRKRHRQRRFQGFRKTGIRAMVRYGVVLPYWIEHRESSRIRRDIARAAALTGVQNGDVEHGRW